MTVNQILRNAILPLVPICVPDDYDGEECEYCTFLSTPKGTNKPYIVVEYQDDDEGLSVTPSYPTAEATISRTGATTFSWKSNATSYYTLEDIVAASAVIRWKYSGQSDYTEVACDTSSQHTFPANTFAEGTIQWQVVVTANSGVTTESDWVTVEVAEPTSSAIAVSPSNTVLDGTAEQKFVWEHIISNGTEQSAFDLQTSSDDNTWTTLRSVSTSETSTTIPANTLETGDLYWRVRTYNLVGTAGDWSEPAHCIVVAAPGTPAVTADDLSPRFILRWQQTGQQAYELKVDGDVISKTYTAESIYKHTGYLTPGEHEFSVRIQNKYGLWSDWGTTTLLIQNNDSGSIVLNVTGSNAVTLAWSSDMQHSGYLIYRNDKLIAKTAATSYVDQFAVGETTYHVRGVYDDNGNYTMSEALTVRISPKSLMVTAIDDPEWIDLRLSMSSLRANRQQRTKSVTYTHYVAHGLPAAEIGEALDQSYALDCAWRISDREHIQKFESLLGKLVCIKTPSERRIVGILDQMSIEENCFFSSYNAQITEVEWVEEPE